jgi:hypothetical protein
MLSEGWASVIFSSGNPTRLAHYWLIIHRVPEASREDAANYWFDFPENLTFPKINYRTAGPNKAVEPTLVRIIISSLFS